MQLKDQFLEDMRRIARESGVIALDLIRDSDPSLKEDQSVLTRADTAISRHIRQSLRKYLKTGEHILIEEEDKENARYFDQELLASTPYIWVVDPIDGTRSFSNRMPFFGISISLLKDLRPWLGYVYFPALNEACYADGTGAHIVENVFSPAEKQYPVTPIDMKITQQSVFFGSDTFFRDYDWDYGFCQVMLPACAVIDLCWPAVGRGCGCFFKAHIWDFAGSWPIWKAAGLDLRSVKDGTVLDKIETGFFCGDDTKTWKLKEPYLLSSERNYSLIKNSMKIRSKSAFSSRNGDFAP